jgi:hypothetical protein
VRENAGERCTEGVVFGGEEASHEWSDPEQVQHTPGDVASRNPDRLLSAGKIDSAVAPSLDGLEAFRLALELNPFGRGDPKFAQAAAGKGRKLRVEADQALRLGVRKRPQYD